jgi:hypothetical protein
MSGAKSNARKQALEQRAKMAVKSGPPTSGPSLSKRSLRWRVEHAHDQFRSSLEYGTLRKKEPKVGRNDPCPGCLAEGVTIKYKRCQRHCHG